MKRIFGLAVSLALVFACFGFGGVKSELESNTEDIPKLTQADLNYVWLESKGSQTLGYNTLKVVNSYVGQTLTETIEIRNKTKETLNYTLTTELMDCENKEVWQDGDRLAMKLSSYKFSLKAGEKKQVPVTIQVLKNHSGNAYFRIYVVPSKGKKEFVSLNICQFDTKAEIMTTKPPAMFKTLSEALKNKTKLGRLIRKPDKTFLIYGNIHLFCFDTKNGKFSWHYNNKTSIIDITIYEGFIFTQNSEKLFIKNGKACVHKEDEETPRRYDQTKDYEDFLIKERTIYNLGMTSFQTYRMGEGAYEYPFMFKPNLESETTWEEYRASHINHTPYHPELIYIGAHGYEFQSDSLALYELETGKLVCDLGYFYSFVFKKEQKLIISHLGYSHLMIHDMISGKNIFNVSTKKESDPRDSKMTLRVTDTGSSIIFTDFKQVGAYDYTKRKLLWRHFGDGEPLCDPVFDKASNSVYLLDEDSKADDKGKITKNAEYLRLYKFDASTGKQLWKAVLFKIPKDCYGDYSYSKIDLKVGKVLVSYTTRCQDYADKGFSFTVRASDGKPWK